MRTLSRNKRKFYYAKYKGKELIVDEHGNETGEGKPVYSKPKIACGNISASRGEAVTRQFGESENYDKVIVLSNDENNIDEYTRLWVDIEPLLGVNGEAKTAHDYVVEKVAKSLNFTLIAISKVKVNYE